MIVAFRLMSLWMIGSAGLSLGWVSASFITSVTSTPCCSHIRASWFAKAMFMSRNVFSASLAISAVGASVLNSSAAILCCLTLRLLSVLGFQQTLLWRFRALFFLERGLNKSLFQRLNNL